MPLVTVQELENARENNVYTNLTVSGVSTPKAAAGFIERILINDAGAKTIRVFDNTAASGASLGILDAPGKGFVPFGCRFSVGLTVSAVSASDITIIYR